MTPSRPDTVNSIGTDSPLKKGGEIVHPVTRSKLRTPLQQHIVLNVEGITPKNVKPVYFLLYQGTKPNILCRVQ